MNKPTPLSQKQMRSALICFNKEVLVMDETPYSCRLRIKLRHGGAARLYGRFFPLRNYHEYVLDDLGLAFFKLFRDKPISLEKAAEALQDEHKLSFYEALTLAREYTGRLMQRGIAVLEIADHHSDPL